MNVFQINQKQSKRLISKLLLLFLNVINWDLWSQQITAEQDG